MIDVKVAELLFRIETEKETAMLARMTNYAPFLTDADGEDTTRRLFVVDADAKVSIPEQEPLRIFAYDLTEDKAVMRIYPDRYMLSILNVDSGKTFTIDCPMAENKIGGGFSYSFLSNITGQEIAPPRHIIDHLLIFGFSVAAARSRTLLIHASTIVYKGRAVMFLGESGTGKSTHSRMWLENIPDTELLNDDAPALGFGADGTVTAYGSPWSGKIACYKNESYPLEAFVRIKRAPHNRIERQPILQSFGAVLPSCLPTLQQKEDMLDPVCDTLSDILEKVPVYILECLPDADAARVSSSEIFGK